jgi:hypothetical protein
VAGVPTVPSEKHQFPVFSRISRQYRMSEERAKKGERMAAMRLFYWMIITNAVGLAFGIIGAWLIWRNGLPPADTELHAIWLNSSPDPEEVEKNKARHAARSKLGMLFLVIGFGLQFVGNLLTVFI